MTVNVNGPHMSYKPERKGCINRGTLIAGVLLVAIFFIIAGCAFITTYMTSVVQEQTWYIPGDPSKWDPIAYFGDIQKHAGENAQLYEIEAYYVKSDGTVDLYASYYPRINYKFYIPLDEPPADAPPIGAGGRRDSKWYEPVTVEVYEPGKMWSVTSGSSSYTYINYGMDRDANSPVNSLPGELITGPTCSFKTIWSAAMEHGAPSDAVAIINYDVSGYEFRISDENVNLKFNRECRIQN